MEKLWESLWVHPLGWEDSGNLLNKVIYHLWNTSRDLTLARLTLSKCKHVTVTPS